MIERRAVGELNLLVGADAECGTLTGGIAFSLAHGDDGGVAVGIDVEAVWQMPTIFIGSPEQIRSDLRARRERFGLSYLVVGEDGLPALAEIVSGL